MASADSQPLRVFTTARAGSGEQPSLAHLQALSQKTAVQALLYCGLYDPHLTAWHSGASSKEEIKQQLVSHEDKVLSQLRHEHCTACTCSQQLVEWRHPVSEGIVENAAAFNANLILLPASRTLPSLDYKDWDILTRAEAPVLVCNTTGYRAYKKILVAVDPTHAHGKAIDADQRLLSEANFIGQLFGSEIHVVHAYPSVRTYVTPDLLVPQEMINSWAAEAKQAVNELVEDQGIHSVHMIDEHPRKAILDTARRIDADLIVMGATSRSLIPDLIIGHTAEHVINHSEIDVLTVNATKNTQ